NGADLRLMPQVLKAYCDYTDYPGWNNADESLYESAAAMDQAAIEFDADIHAIEKRGFATPKTGRWQLHGGVSEDFWERVRLCVAEAGRALPDYSKGTRTEVFWLHRLRLDLLENNSNLFTAERNFDQPAMASEKEGTIHSVCVTSATFCSRLKREALEHRLR